MTAVRSSFVPCRPKRCLGTRFRSPTDSFMRNRNRLEQNLLCNIVELSHFLIYFDTKWEDNKATYLKSYMIHCFGTRGAELWNSCQRVAVLNTTNLNGCIQAASWLHLQKNHSTLGMSGVQSSIMPNLYIAAQAQHLATPSTGIEMLGVVHLWGRNWSIVALWISGLQRFGVS